MNELKYSWNCWFPCRLKELNEGKRAKIQELREQIDEEIKKEEIECKFGVCYVDSLNL